ncbi:MAG: ATP-binding cassette domain-containing protein, partial [Actinomycetota bacterium]
MTEGGGRLIATRGLTKRYRQRQRVALSRRQPAGRPTGVARSYGDVVAADNITFDVGAGEVVGILGPNGAGKTTILRMLAGILTPSDGDATVAGFDPAQQPFEVKQRVGFLSGDTALYERLTPREILRFFGELHALDGVTIAARTAALADELAMADFIDRRCGTLSTGQRQKANLARAFLHSPPVVIIDEPTSSLDFVTGRFVIEAIGRAKHAGQAILFSTHIMSEAEMLCDRVLLLHGGRILDSGSVPELCERTN